MKTRRLCIGLVLVFSLTGACSHRDGSICAQYLDRYTACIAQIGPQARAAAEENLRRERERIRQLERDGKTRAQMASACQASLEAIANTCR